MVIKRLGMTQDILCLKCPFCSTVFRVRNVPGIEEKNVTCPVCKRNAKFVNFKMIMPDEAGDETDLGEETDYRIPEKIK